MEYAKAKEWVCVEAEEESEKTEVDAEEEAQTSSHLEGEDQSSLQTEGGKATSEKKVSNWKNPKPEKEFFPNTIFLTASKSEMHRKCLNMQLDGGC